MDPMMVGVGEMIGKSFGNPLAKQGEENGRWNFRIMGRKSTGIYDEMILESNNTKTKLKPKKQRTSWCLKSEKRAVFKIDLCETIKSWLKIFLWKFLRSNSCIHMDAYLRWCHDRPTNDPPGFSLSNWFPRNVDATRGRPGRSQPLTEEGAGSFLVKLFFSLKISSTEQRK